MDGKPLVSGIPTADALRQGRLAAQAYIDDPGHSGTTDARWIMDQHFARCREDAVSMARECLLNLIADAHRFDEDVDGDEGHITINYHLTVGHSQLEELAAALGITPQYSESVGDALKRVIEAA